MGTIRHFSMRVVAVTLAGAVAGGATSAALTYLRGWGNSLSIVGMGVLFAVMVLGTAAWMYRGRFERRQWPRWLAAGWILAVGMPTAVYVAIFGVTGLGNVIGTAGIFGAYVEVELGLLAVSMVWSFAMATAMGVSLYRGIRYVSTFLICTAWMFWWCEFCLVGYASSALLLGANYQVPFAGGQAITAMLIGYYLEKYLVDETRGLAAFGGGFSVGVGGNAEV